MVAVVDGDDMSKYDDELLAIQQDEDDDAALNQLEWELASQEGRFTGEGGFSKCYNRRRLGRFHKMLQ